MVDVELVANVLITANPSLNVTFHRDSTVLLDIRGYLPPTFGPSTTISLVRNPLVFNSTPAMSSLPSASSARLTSLIVPVAAFLASDKAS